VATNTATYALRIPAILEDQNYRSVSYKKPRIFNLADAEKILTREMVSWVSYSNSAHLNRGKEYCSFQDTDEMRHSMAAGAEDMMFI